MKVLLWCDSSNSKRMAHSREFERHIPRWALHRVHGEEAQHEQRWQLRRIEPLVVRRKASDSSDAHVCHPAARASESESFRPQPAGPEDTSTDPEPKDSQYVPEVPWTPPTSTMLEELMVPDSPEIHKEPFIRSINSRRANLRKDNLDLAQLRAAANVESIDGSQSARARSVEHDGQGTPGQCFSQETLDHLKRKHVRIPPSAKEATLIGESFDGTFGQDLNEATGSRSHLTENGLEDVARAGEKPSEGSFTVGKPVQLLSLEQELEGRSLSVGWQYLTKRVQALDSLNLEGRVPLTTFSRASGKPTYGSSEGFRKAKDLLGEALEGTQSYGEIQGAEYKRNESKCCYPSKIPLKRSKAEETTLRSGSTHYAPVTSAVEIEYQRNPLDVRTATLKEINDRSPRPPFVTEPGRPLDVSSAELAKSRSMTGNGDLFESKVWAECPAAGSQKQSDAQYPLHTEASRPMPVISFVSGSRQPFSVSQPGLARARSLFADNGLQDKEHWPTKEDAGFQEHSSSDIQCPRSCGEDRAFPLTCFVTGNMKPLAVSSESLMKARELFGDDFHETKRQDELVGAGIQRIRNKGVHSLSGAQESAMQRNLSQDVESPRSTEASDAVLLDCFVTGNMESLYVSSESLLKARALFGDVYEKEEQQAELINAGCQRNQTGALPLTSFVTGNMKPVSVSSGSLMKARELFGEALPQTERWEEPVGAGFQQKGNRELEAFSAGGKIDFERNFPQDIQSSGCKEAEGALPLERLGTGNMGSLSAFSEDSLTKARALLGQTHEKEEQLPDPAGAGSHRDQTRAVPMTCFVTGNMKPMSVSPRSLMKARELFADELHETERWDELAGAGVQRKRSREVDTSGGWRTGIGRTLPRNIQSPTCKEAEGALPPKCFGTGNMGSLSVSSENLMKARTLRGDAYEKEDQVPDLAGAGSHRNYTHAVSMSCFVTGNMKSVSVSSESFAKAKALLGDAYEKEEQQPELAGTGSQRSSKQGRTSLISDPSGKASMAPHSTVERLQKESTTIDGSKRATARIEDGDVRRRSLTTMRNASGNSITVSSSAMKRARTLLELDERETGNCGLPHSTRFSGQIKDTNRSVLREFNSTTYGLHADNVANTSPKRANASIGEIEKSQLANEDDEKENHLRLNRDWGAKDFEHLGDKNLSLDSGYGPSVAPVASSFGGQARERLGGESFRPQSGRQASVSDKAVDKARVLPEVGERRAFSTDESVCPPFAEFHSSAREDLSRAVHAFKPPRKQSDASFESADIQMQQTSPISAGARTISDLPHHLAHACSSTAFSGREYLPSSMSDHLQDGGATYNSGWRKLQECLMTADEAECHRIQYIAADGGRHNAGSLEAWKLLQQRGADPRYASQAWVANHFRWIVWKLASIERRCPGPAVRPPLTVDTVLHELKCRYDKEMAGRRSAIKRITEGSSSAATKMFLCVSAIRQLGDNEGLHQQQPDERQQKSAKIEVTDGWYRLNAILDIPLTRQVQLGRLKTGQKIQVCGARLNSRPDGSSPLEAFQDCLLMLYMNGVYRARRDQKLGFRREHYIPLAFKGIKPEGGLVQQTYVGVTRVYPILYKETSEDFSVMRSTRAEELAVGQFESRRAEVMDEAMLKLENFYKSSLSPEEKDEDNRLFIDVENAAEPDILMAEMTPAQLKEFAAYQEKKNISKQTAMENAVKGALQEARLDSRNVKRVLRVRVVGLITRGNESRAVSTNEGTITIWDVGDEHYIQEGCVYRVSGLRPVTRPCSRNAKSHQIHLDSFGSSTWRQVPQDAYDKIFLFPYTCRLPTLLSDLDEKFVNREFDTAVMVIKVEEPFYTGAYTNQWVFAADGSTARDCPWDETEMLAIRLSLPSPAFVRIADSLVGSVIGYCNLLQRPRDSNRRLWVAEASEQAFLSSNLSHPNLRHLQPAAVAVSKRVNHHWMAEQLRDHLQMMISGGSDWPPSCR